MERGGVSQLTPYQTSILEILNSYPKGHGGTLGKVDDGEGLK